MIFQGFVSKRLSAHRRKALAVLIAAIAAIAALSAEYFLRGAPPSSEAAFAWVPVENGDVSRPLFSMGQLEPLNAINVAAPFSGKLIKKFVQNGDAVEKGAPLMELDSNDILMEKRDAEVALTRASDTLQELQNWHSGAEMLAAERQLAASKVLLQNATAHLAETQALFDKGIVARMELDNAKNELASAQMQNGNAQDGLAAIAKKGSTAQINVAQLEQKNRAEKLNQSQGRLGQAVVRAPISGIVLHSNAERAPGGMGAKEPEVGAYVQAREALMVIGDTTSFIVKAELDERDIVQAKLGMPVEITMGLDNNLQLAGTVQHVSSEAKHRDMAGPGAPPSFEISVLAKDIPDATRPLLRIGMTARLHLLPPAAKPVLTIPLDALSGIHGQLAQVLRRNAHDAQGTRITVTLGQTLADRVVVTQGLAVGDEVAIPPRTAANAPDTPPRQALALPGYSP